MNVYTHGLPDYNILSKADKRAILLPLVDVIRDYYKAPQNRQAFEKWKTEYLAKNPL